MFNGFFSEKFIEPLCHYYTLEATLVYGLILVLAALGIYRLLKMLKIKIDKCFLCALLPFIIYGGTARALRDHGLGVYGDNWYFCSPPIYFVIFCVAIGSLLLGLVIQKKFRFEYWKTMAIIGSLLVLYNLTLVEITNWFGFSVILMLIAFWSIVFFGLNYLKPKLLSLTNAGIVVAHLFDASATFSALTFFNYYEQHVLPRFLIDASGPWIMFPLKIVVVWLVLHIIDKYSEDKFFNSFLKIIILILGLALGLRDFLTVSML